MKREQIAVAYCSAYMTKTIPPSEPPFYTGNSPFLAEPRTAFLDCDRCALLLAPGREKEKHVNEKRTDCCGLLFGIHDEDNSPI